MIERGERALVLGGGGQTGIAWLYGVIAGLAEHGVDLSRADLVVGTSAGAAVGANLAGGRDVAKLYAAQLEPATGEISARTDPRMMLRLGAAAVLGPRGAQNVRARIGRFALRSSAIPESERLAAIASRLDGLDWPTGTDLLATAVEAYTGEFRAFDRDSRVPLVEAVAASCAVPGLWPPVSTLGTRWIDGGFRSSANADLAAGYRRVIVLAPLAVGFGAAATPRTQTEALAATARATLVTPDRASREAIGRDVFDLSRRPPSARAGYAQARSAADTLRAIWN